ncbi:MAG: DNA translocase FtsK [Patescibacteria group bacterium]|nr:DNA translocase FtsK [Patescibacteria group bacterium]
MSRRKKKKQKQEQNGGKNFKAKGEKEGFLDELSLHPDTKKSIWGIVFLGLAIILLLADFDNAGPAGNFLYKIFAAFLGAWGYFLLPLIFLTLGIVFLSSERKKIYGAAFLGAILFVFSGLGFIDIIFNGDKAGLLGKSVGSVQNLFGFTASIVIISVLLIISFLVTLNLPIKIKRKEKIRDDWGENEEIDEEMENEMMPEEPETEEIEKEPKKEFELDIKDKIVAAMPAIASRKIFKKKSGTYIFPPLDLLKSSIEKPTSGDLRANANIIKRTLESFGILVEMGEINIGPKVTRYTLKPAEGIKLSRIIALSQDLALALAAHPIRIEAPIPGKSLVGIEVPNKAAAVVRLGSLMNYPEFISSGQISFALGRDVTGEPIFADIKKMPHLLIAGSTGSGKSVAIHSILTSLLYKNSPSDLRLILIDPKRVELSIYESIPHLIAPVITESKKSLGVFKWALNEMDRRYEILLKAGSRDIHSYSKKNPDEILPYIVIVVDELADLMSTYGREVEGYIVRLAQMARATGLHLILSTQRPSVEIITGLIKANITSRIALQVASQVDSRTILDTSGAEKLLGGGDMLFISSELSKPKRIQGAYLTEEEIRKVADFLRENNKDIIGEDKETPDFNVNNNSENGKIKDVFDDFLGEDGDEDELLDEAIKIVTQAQKASASLLQRRLKIGYARAARLLDIMEAQGIVGPGEGAKPREVFRQELG